MIAGQDERRQATRLGPAERGIAAARVRPGYDVAVVDVSAGGMLVESGRRLLPGVSVEVQIDAAGRKVVVRGTVVRCAVARLRSGSVCYRGAICFDRHLLWFAEADGGGYQIPSIETVL
ncbi:MAG: PilZ domain-containing protein [Betaproteobacteria bacterium]